MALSMVLLPLAVSLIAAERVLLVPELALKRRLRLCCCTIVPMMLLVIH